MKRKEILVILLILMMLTLIAGCTGPTVKFGSIDVNSTPTGAKVYINGVDTGMITPIIFTKEVGDYTVKLDKFQYKIWEATVTVYANQTTGINAPLTPASPETITLQPGSEGKDSFVIERYPDENKGSFYRLNIGYSVIDSTKYRAYLQFDLGAVPENARIINADLKLYPSAIEGFGSFTMGLYKVMSDWEEGTITWDMQPISSSEAEVLSTINTFVTNWITLGISDLVQGWLDGSITNYGILLKALDEESANIRIGFWSSDWGVDTSCPKLKMDYYIP